ncbi:MAG: ribosomal protein S18-alanine N-acetyltransferase [Anaerolineales bacterium]|nr:ribosomal protein S18-alanine N-acetyltransferase [Anaerolineales bacterium]
MIVKIERPIVREMNIRDLKMVLRIDRLSFPIPWSERTYRFELSENNAAHLYVAEIEEEGKWRVVGYIGYWSIIDEAHISTLAVHPDYREQGIGELLLRRALSLAARSGATIATLEVRESNKIAQNLYRKYGFRIVGKRSRYYRDNNEDAHIMMLDDLGSVMSHHREFLRESRG